MLVRIGQSDCKPQCVQEGTIGIYTVLGRLGFTLLNVLGYFSSKGCDEYKHCRDIKQGKNNIEQHIYFKEERNEKRDERENVYHTGSGSVWPRVLSGIERTFHNSDENDKTENNQTGTF
jgi:hypothetical protein